jgi:hypothetical protein
MSRDTPLIPRIDWKSVLDQQGSLVLGAQESTDCIPKPPSVPLKTNHAPSLRQSNTALIPQRTPAMTGKNSSLFDLTYKQVLKGRLGVRTARETQQSSNPAETSGSQSFRSTYEVLNNRCGSFSAKVSDYSTRSETNQMSQSALSWYERRAQTLSMFDAPLFGFSSSHEDQTYGVTNITSSVKLRPYSSGQVASRPLAVAPPKQPRPTTAIVIGDSINSCNHPPVFSASSKQHKEELTSNPQAQCFQESTNSPRTCKVSTPCSSLKAKTQKNATTVSSFGQPCGELNPKFRRPSSQSIYSPAVGLSVDSIDTQILLPTLEQAMTELIKGHSLKKFSHASQRVTYKLCRINSNAELLVDDQFVERVVAIVDGLSDYSVSKQSVLTQDDFVPKFVQILCSFFASFFDTLVPSTDIDTILQWLFTSCL